MLLDHYQTAFMSSATEAEFAVIDPRGALGMANPLSALEQRVVALSLYDHRSSIGPEPRAIRFLATVFGWRSPNRLADAKLEALRRYGIILRDGVGDVPAEERERVREAGFSEAALAEVRRLVGFQRH